MRVAVISLGLLMSSLCVKAQKFPYDILDRFCKCPEMEWGMSKFELKEIGKSNNDLEIRLRIHQGIYWSIKVITFKDGIYKAHLYHKRNPDGRYWPDSLTKYKGKWEMYPYKRFPVLGKDLKLLTAKLLELDLLKIPYQSEITKEPIYTPFFLQVKLSGKTNSFSFGGMEELISLYPSEKRYRDYQAILLVFNELTNAGLDNEAFRLAYLESEK